MDALERLRSNISSACRQALLASGQRIRDTVTSVDLDFDIKIGEVLNPKEVVIEATIGNHLPQDLGICKSKIEIMDALLAASMSKQSDTGISFMLFADEEPCRPNHFSLERGGLVIVEGNLGSQLFLDVCLGYRRFDRRIELYIY